MVELFVPSREPAGGSIVQGQGQQSREGGQKPGLGMAPGPWGSPLPTVLILAERKDNTIYLQEGIRNKTRVESRRSLF